MQTEESIKNYKQKLRKELVDEPLRVNAFCSYADVPQANVPDMELIEKTFIYFDLRVIAKLFEIYPGKYVHKVWRERMAVQDDNLFNLNVMIALYYFDIRQPEKYMKRIERK